MDIERGRRRSRRESVIMMAHCRTATGRSGDVAIVDLTAEGCCIFTKAVPVGQGLRIRLRPEHLDCLTGVVRWAARGYAGVEFDKPLYGAVADHLQTIWASNR